MWRENFLTDKQHKVFDTAEKTFEFILIDLT
jgi:hypothetical protein